MTSIRPVGGALLACLTAALVVTGCGTSAPTAAPVAPVTAPPQSFAPTLPPATAPPAVTITLPPDTSTPGPSGAPPAASAAVDPSADLEIGAPYAFEPLDPALAEVFIAAMEQSLGSMSNLFQVGVKSAVQDGESVAWVIVMAFPDIPIRGDTLLDAAAQGAAGQGDVEALEVAGQSVRIIQSEGIYSVLTMVDDELVMAISGERADGLAVITSIIGAN